MRVKTKVERKGLFWLPEKEDRQVHGTLFIECDGAVRLEIIGHFDENIERPSINDSAFRIVGHVEIEGAVTLEDCFYTKKNFSFGGISRSEILVNTALFGAIWPEQEDITFNTFSFSVDCLDEWIGITGIEVKEDFQNWTAVISYSPPESIVLQLENGMKLKIGFKNSLPSFPHTTEAKITQSAYLQLESEDLRPLSEFDKVALKLINFICFAMDEIVAIKDVSATSKEIESPISPTQKSRVPIVIYYKSHSYTEKKPQKHWHEMLFRFSSIKENAEFVFNAWINSYETLLPAFYLYFSTRIDASKYLESKFLSLAQGLESYHRRTSNEKRMQEDDFEEIVSKIIEKFPEHQEFLEGRLQHGNEITFRKRLQRIFEPFKSHFGSSKERGSLINKIANTRNYLTHYDESLESEAAKGTELWNISVKMEVVFSLNFLRVIGFSDSEIASMVKSNRPLGQKLYQLRE